MATIKTASMATAPHAGDAGEQSGQEIQPHHQLQPGRASATGRSRSTGSTS